MSSYNYEWPEAFQAIFNSNGVFVGRVDRLIETVIGTITRHKVLCGDGKERWIKLVKGNEWRTCKPPLD